MDTLSRVTESIKRLLYEAELKKVLGGLKKGDLVQMGLTDGNQYLYKIETIQGDDLLIRDTKNNKELFTFNANDYKTNGLTIYQYADGKKGDSITLELDNLAVGTPGGKIYTIDPIDSDMDLNFEPGFDKREPEIDDDESSDDGDDLNFEPGFDKREPEIDDDEIESDSSQEMIDSWNKTILSIKEGQNLHFTINVDKEAEIGSEKDNNLALEVIKISENYVQCVLIDINGPISALLTKLLNNKHLVIKKDNLIKVEDGNAILDVVDIKTENNISIPNIVWVGINQYEHEGGGSDEGDDSEKHTLSQSELDDILLNNKTVANYWLRTPGALGVLAGASPAGRYTIAQQMKDLKLKTTYFSEGDEIEFKLITLTRKGGGGFDLERGKIYYGKMIKDNVIIALGKKNNRHWEITLVDPENDDEHMYNVKYSFCKNRNKCYPKGTGTIKITDIK